MSVFFRLTTNDGQLVPAANAPGTKPGWVEVKDFSFDVEQTLNIGSQSTGAGAGKITFNPVSFTLAPGSLDPKLFQAAASGTPYKMLEVQVIPSAGGTAVEEFTFKLVAVKTLGWSIDPSSKELQTKVTLEYGSLSVAVPGPTPITAGWDRTKNVAV